MRFSLRNLAFATLAVAGLTVQANAQGPSVQWCITWGAGNSRHAAGTGTADAISGQVILDHLDTADRTAGGLGMIQYGGNFSVWIKNLTGAAIPFVTSNTLIEFDQANSSNAGRSLKLTQGPTLSGNFSAGNAANIPKYGAFNFNAGWGNVVGTAGNVNVAAGATAPGDTAATIRSSGYFVSLNNSATLTLAANGEMRLMDFTVMNNTLGNGGATLASPQRVSIYDAGTGTSNTTFVRMSSSTTNYRPTGDAANSTTATQKGNFCGFEVVPEPGTMVALAAGLGALLARRRRKA